MSDETTNRKGAKMRAHITSSKLQKGGTVAVLWSDGVEFIYDATLTLTTAGLYDAQRQAISRTSAELTLSGVGC
jgi:hypothetical protein